MFGFLERFLGFECKDWGSVCSYGGCYTGTGNFKTGLKFCPKHAEHGERVHGVKQEVKMEELKITKEAVLKAAEKCSTAKEVLREMFPDVFREKYEKGHVYKNNGLYGGAFYCFMFRGERAFTLLNGLQEYTVLSDGMIGEHLADSPEEYYRNKFAGKYGPSSESN